MLRGAGVVEGKGWRKRLAWFCLSFLFGFNLKNKIALLDSHLSFILEFFSRLLEGKS